MPASSRDTPSRPYPDSWEDVAELRVFRASTERWQRLMSWRTDMRRRGWKLLQVTAEGDQIAAVFGRTREELLSRQEPRR